ncbi:MAG: DUF123 domain-containing protein [Anaerolineae bacterium]|jgi:Uri superfamily endonuclease
MGTYILVLWLELPDKFRAGRLDEYRFPSGYYLYAGSAHGPGGLAARVGRHLRRVGYRKRAHWHVDYLRERAVWIGAWAASGLKAECDWAAELRQLRGARVIAPGFGSSDCRCPAHLVHVPALPAAAWFASTLGAERLILGDVELDELLHALGQGSDERREAAAVALGRLGPDAGRPLAIMLESGNRDARWWAARALAEVGGEEAGTALRTALADPDPDVRACGALALGRIGAGAQARALAQLLSDESAFVASVAADALSMIGEPAVEALAALLSDERARTRLLAARALGRIGSEATIGHLLGLLDDSSYLVRHHAHEALEALGVGMIFFSP